MFNRKSMETDLSKPQVGDLLLLSKDRELIKLTFKRVTSNGQVNLSGTTIWVKSIKEIDPVLYMLGFRSSDPIIENVSMLLAAAEKP